MEETLRTRLSRGLVVGLDGLEHMTPLQLGALRRRDHTQKKLDMMRKVRVRGLSSRGAARHTSGLPPFTTKRNCRT